MRGECYVEYEGVEFWVQYAWEGTKAEPDVTDTWVYLDMDSQLKFDLFELLNQKTLDALDGACYDDIRGVK